MKIDDYETINKRTIIMLPSLIIVILLGVGGYYKLHPLDALSTLFLGLIIIIVNRMISDKWFTNSSNREGDKDE